jgi:CxxC motif-containing protein
MQSIYATTPVAIKVSSPVAQMDVLAAQLIAGGVDLLSRKDIGQLHYL